MSHPTIDWQRLGSRAIVGSLIGIAAVTRGAPDRGQGLFTGALAFGLLISPVLWAHYVVLLLVPMAISRPRPDRVWTFYLCLWLSPFERPPTLLQGCLALFAIAAIAGLTTRRDLDFRLVDLPKVRVKSGLDLGRLAFGKRDAGSVPYHSGGPMVDGSRHSPGEAA